MDVTTSVLPSDSQQLIQTLEAYWQEECLLDAMVRPICQLLLTHGDKKVRWRAAECLRFASGEHPEELILSLIRATTDEAYYVSLHSSRVLQFLGRRHDIVPPLSEAIRDDNHHIRQKAAEEMGRLTDPRCPEVLLDTAQHDSAPEVRLTAIRSLIQQSAPRELARQYVELLASEQVAINRAETLRLIAKHPGRRSQLAIRACTQDRKPEVREQAFQLLTSSVEQQNRPTLRKAYTHDSIKVRRQLAMAQARHNVLDPALAEDLLTAVRDKTTGLVAFQALADLANQNHRFSGDLVLRLKPELLCKLTLEWAAQGLLPTVGLKIWYKGPVIYVPAYKEEGEDRYPWEDLGVHHHYLTHGLPESLTEKHACFHSDWFPDIHLIAISQLVSHLQPTWNPETSPVLVEGFESGLISQSGGTVIEMEKMRKLSGARLTDRIDFVYGFQKDLRQLQYLMFAGAAANLILGGEYTIIETTAAEIWEQFRRQLQAVLVKHDLARLAETQWFSVPHRRSLRYEQRFETPYAQIRPGLVQLVDCLQSQEGGELRQVVGEVTAKATNRVGKLMEQAVRRLPMPTWFRANKE